MHVQQWACIVLFGFATPPLAVQPRLSASQAADQEDPALWQRIAHRCIWVEPSLLAEIEYRAKSAEGKVRHPVFKGVRDDL
jgi:ATP-dependent DNA ligase